MAQYIYSSTPLCVAKKIIYNNGSHISNNLQLTHHVTGSSFSEYSSNIFYIDFLLVVLLSPQIIR